MSKFTKFVLPNAVDFLRHIVEVIFLNHKEDNTTDTTLDPIVSRAKNLVDKRSVVVTSFERKESKNG